MSISIHIKNKTILTILVIMLSTIIIVAANTQSRVVNLDEVIVGDLRIHYQNQHEIPNIKKFYESVRQFSQEIVNECTGLAEQEKNDCVQTKIDEAEKYEINVNKCTGAQEIITIDIDAIKNQKKEGENDYGRHTITGFIEELDFTGARHPILTLKQEQEPIIIRFSDALGANIFTENQHVRVTGIITEVDLDEKIIRMRIGERGMTDNAQRHNYIEMNPEEYLTYKFTNAVKQISNCAKSTNTSCRCEVEFPKGEYNVTFERDNFFKDEKIKHFVPVNFITQQMHTGQVSSFAQQMRDIFFNPPGPWSLEYIQQMLEEEYAEAHEEITIQLINKTITQDENTIIFWKRNDEMIIMTTSTLQEIEECAIEIKTYLFCTEYKDKNNYYRNMDTPTMNFALQI